MKDWNKEIDKQIKEKVDALDFPFSEAAWNHMEAKLSANQPINGSYLYPLLGLALIVVAVVIGLNLSYGNYAEDNIALEISKDVEGIEECGDTSNPILCNTISEKYEKFDSSWSHSNMNESTNKINSDFIDVKPILLKHRNPGLNCSLSSGLEPPIFSTISPTQSQEGAKAVKLSQEEKRKNRKNRRELKKLLSKHIRKSHQLGSGINPLPTYWGLRVGTNTSFRNYPFKSKFYLVDGLSGGIYFQYQVTKKLKWQTELGVAHRPNFKLSYLRDMHWQGYDYEYGVTLEGLNYSELQSSMLYNMGQGNVQLGFHIRKFSGFDHTGTYTHRLSQINPNLDFNPPDPDVFKEYTFGPIIGYEWEIINRLSMSTVLTIGIRDLTTNQFFDRKKHYGASSLQFSLKYQLNKTKEIISGK